MSSTRPVTRGETYCEGEIALQPTKTAAQLNRTKAIQKDCLLCARGMALIEASVRPGASLIHERQQHDGCIPVHPGAEWASWHSAPGIVGILGFHLYLAGVGSYAPREFAPWALLCD